LLRGDAETLNKRTGKLSGSWNRTESATVSTVHCDVERRFARFVKPKTLEKIKIPAKTIVKFRVAKAAKDAILGAKKESGFSGR
jgi:hypothetical protein